MGGPRELQTQMSGAPRGRRGDGSGGHRGGCGELRALALLTGQPLCTRAGAAPSLIEKSWRWVLCKTS